MGEIKKQSINNSVLSYIGAGLGFLTIYIQPHLISSSDIGLIRLMYSFSWMTATLMPLGIGSIGLRYFSKIRNESNGHNGFFFLLLIITSIGACLIGGLLYFNKGIFSSYYERSPEFPKYFNESLVLAYILGLIAVYGIYSASLYKTSFTVFLTDIYARVGQLLVVVIYHYQLIDKDTFVLCYIGIFLVQLILLLIYLLRHGAVSFKINFKFYRSLNLKDVAFFGLLMMFTALASLGVKYIDQLIIGHYLNEALVGVYATCIMMCAVMEIPFNSLERIASPKIASAWNVNNREEVQKIYSMSSKYMFFVAGLLFCLLWASIDLIFMFLPPEYHSGKPAFFLISVASLVNSLTGVNSSVILYSHKYFAASVFLIVLLIISIVANSLLIKPFGISGAAAATFIALATFNVLKYIYILLRFKMQPLTKHTLYTLVSIGISLLFIFLLPASWHAVLRAVVGCAFSGIVFALMNIKFDTINEVNKVFRRFGVLK